MGERVGVNVSVTKMIEGTPDVLKELLLGAFITDDSIPVAIVDGAANGFNKNCERFYHYGRDHYTEGLPGRATFSAEAPTLAKRDDVITVLEGIEGEPIRIIELSIRTLSTQAIAKEWLQDTVGQDWDPIAQVLTQAGKKYYIHQAAFVGGFLNISLRIVSQRAPRLIGVSEFGTINIVTDVATISLSEVYYHVVYHVVSDPYYSRTYWNYKYSLGTYPTLDIGTDIISGTSFMPIAPIRRNKVNVVDDTTFNTHQKKSVSRLLDTIGVDLQEMTNSLNDPEDAENLDNVDEVFVMFAMDFDSDDTIALPYMCESFRTFHFNESVTQTEWLAWWNLGEEARALAARPKNAIYMSDSSVSMQLEWNFTTMAVKNGLASSGAAAPNPFTVVPAFTPTSYSPRESDDIVKVVVIDSVNTELEFNDERQQLETKLPDDDDDDIFNTHSIVYRRQLTTVAGGDASDTYEEILLHGAIATYDVYRGAAKGRGEFVRDVTSMSDGGFMLPVSFDIVNQFNGFDKSKVYYESLQAVVYAVQIQHLGFFQSGLFAAIISVIAIVVALITAQPWIGLSGFAAVAATVIFIISLIIGSYLVTKAFELIAEVVGGKFLLILATIVAVYALTYGDTKIFGKLVTAEDFLFLSNSALAGANKKIGDDIRDILLEGFEATAAQEKRQEALDDRYEEEFGDITTLELYDIIAPPPQLDFNMNIEQWHANKIGNGNPGVLVLDLPRTYHQIALAIPETVQRDINVGTTLKGT